jgi:hypothetical protein
MFKQKKEDYSIIQSIKIAEPCNVDWNSMTGDERKRFCGQCKLNVYNVEKLAQSDVVSLIQENEGNVCMQLYRRQDGTILTENCPVGLRKLRDKARKLIKTAAAVFTWLALTNGADAQNEKGMDHFYTRGRVKVAGQVKPLCSSKSNSHPDVLVNSSKPAHITQKVFTSNFVPEEPSWIPKRPYFPLWVELCQWLTPILASIATIGGLVTLNLMKRARPTTIGLLLLTIWLFAGVMMGYLWSPALKVIPFQ